MNDADKQVHDMVSVIVRALVDKPEKVEVRLTEGQVSSLVEIRVDASNQGQIIGREGRHADAIRRLVSAVGMKLGRRYSVEIL